MSRCLFIQLEVKGVIRPHPAVSVLQQNTEEIDPPPSQVDSCPRALAIQLTLKESSCALLDCTLRGPAAPRRLHRSRLAVTLSSSKQVQMQSDLP